jgi:hypothetical protein
MTMPAADFARQPDILRNLEPRTEPFPFLLSTEALEPALADALLSWLETGVEWRLHEGAFYDQWECDLLSAVPPPSCAPLLTAEALADLTRRVGALFGADLSDRLTVIAHKLIGGQAIGVHNDDPDPGYETHRLVVQLNRRTDRDEGGELLVHGSSRPGDVAFQVAPAHNTVFAFAMSDRSYHSVTAVKGWVRYSVIFSFWTKEADAEAARLEADPGSRPAGGAATMAANLPEEEQDRLAQLVGLLQSIGAGEKSHSDGSLLEHLVHTYLILRSWGASLDQATAGLFHSVYGTEDFHEATVRPEDRPIVGRIIGERAESIAYHYCSCSKRSLHDSLKTGPPYRAHDLRRQETVELDESLFHDLILLDLANEIEQQPRVREDAQTLRARRNLFELAVPFLPEGAVAALRRTYP